MVHYAEAGDLDTAFEHLEEASTYAIRRWSISLLRLNGIACVRIPVSTNVLPG